MTTGEGGSEVRLWMLNLDPPNGGVGGQLEVCTS